MALLRPPGAADEDLFLSRCLHCGQCAAVCPAHCVRLDEPASLLGLGTPVVDPAREPCILCMRCGPACPSGALADVPMERANMGRAELNRATCTQWNDTRYCRTCYEKCPLRATAIVLEFGLNPVVTQACVGCGVCEHVCPVAAITTIPRQRQAFSLLRRLFG